MMIEQTKQTVENKYTIENGYKHNAKVHTKHVACRKELLQFGNFSFDNHRNDASRQKILGTLVPQIFTFNILQCVAKYLLLYMQRVCVEYIAKDYVWLNFLCKVCSCNVS